MLLRLLARRRAWIAAGVATLLGAGATCIVALISFLTGMKLSPAVIAYVFVATWPVAVLAWVASFVLTVDLGVGVPRGACTDPLTEAISRRQDEEGRQLRARLERLGQPSLYWSAWLFCLLSPLTLHLLFALANVWAVDAHQWKEAGEWIAWSISVTWLPHLVLGLLARRYCASLDRGCRSFWKPACGHLALSALSVVPSAIIWTLLGHWDNLGRLPVDALHVVAAITFVAGVIILVTGAAFVPALYWWIRRRHRRERAILEAPIA